MDYYGHGFMLLWADSTMEKNTKSVNFELYLFLRVIIWIINNRVNANQRGTLRNLCDRVDLFNNDLIPIFDIKG